MAGVLTAVISDLHLGIRAGTDLLARADIRRALLGALAGVERVVLLGDVLELRERHLAEAAVLAQPLFAELGQTLGEGATVVLAAGNHDHELAAPLLERAGGSLGLEQTAAPPRTGPLAALARAVAPARLLLAYPGLWVRPDVYATHGHYMDCHSSVPTFECLAIAAVQRLRGRVPARDATPEDYERRVAPVFRAIANAGAAMGRGPGADLSMKLWRQVNTPTEPSGSSRLLSEAIPRAIAAVNLAGLGPFDPDLSGHALRRSGLRSVAETITRLGVEAEHVIFGHTHRSGPILPTDGEGWTLPNGTKLINTGSWLYMPVFLSATPAESPYWPGTCVFVPETGPPELRPLLADRSHADLS